MHSIAQVGLVFAVLMVILSCNKSVDNPNTVTLSTGIDIVEHKEMCDSDKIFLPRLIDYNNYYQLELTTIFSCDAQQEVYLSPSVNHKSSLVFYDNDNAYKCECNKQIKVHIQKKLLEKHSTLYVVYKDEVIDHLIVP